MTQIQASLTQSDSTSAPKPYPLLVSIRWIIRRDMPAVQAIERASFDCPWGYDDFLDALRQRNCIGTVAEHEGQIVGYLLKEFDKTSYSILNLAVAPKWRRREVATQLVGKMKSNMIRRDRISATVRDSNLVAHLFLRSQRFRATTVLPAHQFEMSEDAYVFEYVRNQVYEQGR